MNPCILIHIVSTSLLWGLGFSQSIDQRWPVASREIQRIFRNMIPKPELGSVIFTPVTSQIQIGHLVAEKNISSTNDALDLLALSTCFTRITERAIDTNATVHAPPLGNGLAASRFSIIRPLLELHIVAKGVGVVIHCLSAAIPE
jgi:hypothetical protein